MPKDQFQHSFLLPADTNLELEDACIEYRPNIYSDTAAWELYHNLLDNIDWRQETITVYGKQHLTPRLSCWMGDAQYSYSHTIMQPVAWSDYVMKIKTDIEQVSGEQFNSVLINHYRDGQDSNGWHSDDEPELGINPVIASLSLGAARDFHLRHKTKKALKHKISLENGSLLMMRGTTQQHWQHHVPKRARASGRINLTFRTIIKSS